MFQFILIIHIIAGSICLGSGLVALAAKKGQKAHIFSGRFFYYSMLAVIFSAFYLSIVSQSVFLFTIGIFSLFFILSGKRYLKIIKDHKVKSKQEDWWLTGLAIFAAIVLLIISVFQVIAGDMTSIVSISFSVLALVFGIQDIRIYTNKWQSPVLRLRMHLSRMIAAYITTITAFLVAGMKMWNVFAWLTPTVIGTFFIFYHIHRLKKHRLPLTIIALFVLEFANAQTVQEDIKRYRFAKTYFGLDLNFTPNLVDGIALDINEEIKTFDRTAFLTPAINIGATHFWGYSDFYISLNTADLKFEEDGFKNRTSYRVFTGLRLYPIPSRAKTLRPYIGYKFSALTYSQENLNEQSANTTQTRSFFDVGLTYQSNKYYIYLAYNQLFNNELDFALSRSVMQQIKTPNQFFSFGINFIFDTTAGNENCTACYHFNKIFGASNQNGWYVGIGPSSAFPTQKSSYIREFAPFLNQYQMPQLFPEISIGYHFSKPDILVNTSFRSILQRRNAYDYEQKFQRRSLVLESFKTLGDYHGFVPYLGIGVSLESLNLDETDRGENITDISTTKLTPSFIFGWDIRPSRKGDWWVLRTNLRYAPFLDLEHKGKLMSAQQLEFNFIQFVYYPQRARVYKE